MTSVIKQQKSLLLEPECLPSMLHWINPCPCRQPTLIALLPTPTLTM